MFNVKKEEHGETVTANPGDSARASEEAAHARQAAKEFYSRPRRGLAALADSENDWAGLWKRIAANFVDSLILYIPLTITVVMGTALAGDSVAGLVISLFLFPLVIFVLYHGLLTGGSSVATPGRRVAGIAIVAADSGQPLSYGRSLVRATASFISYWLVFPNLIVAITKKKQSVSDMIVGSTVVSYRPANVAVVAVICVFVVIFLGGILAAIAIPAYQDYVVRARTVEAQGDLRQFAALVEEQWRATGRPPDSLSGLGHSPASRLATFSITPEGVLVAEIPTGSAKAVIGLRPSYSKATDTLQ